MASGYTIGADVDGAGAVVDDESSGSVSVGAVSDGGSVATTALPDGCSTGDVVAVAVGSVAVLDPGSSSAQAADTATSADRGEQESAAAPSVGSGITEALLRQSRVAVGRGGRLMRTSAMMASKCSLEEVIEVGVR